jgi:hypothetical protein
MQNTSLARKAGIVGMASAILWMISAIIQKSLGLSSPDGSALWVAHELMAMTAIVGMVIGFLGLIWGGAVQSRFGKMAVYLYAFGWGLIVIGGGLASVLLQTQDTPISILFPIGGALYDLGALLTGIAVIAAKRWTGWQRFMPLVSFLVIFFAVNLPLIVGATDGPGMIGELIMGACWFGVALAVYTTQARNVAPQSSTITG